MLKHSTARSSEKWICLLDVLIVSELLCGCKASVDITTCTCMQFTFKFMPLSVISYTVERPCHSWRWNTKGSGMILLPRSIKLYHRYHLNIYKQYWSILRLEYETDELPFIPSSCLAVLHVRVHGYIQSPFSFVRYLATGNVVDKNTVSGTIFISSWTSPPASDDEEDDDDDSDGTGTPRTVGYSPSWNCLFVPPAQYHSQGLWPMLKHSTARISQRQI